jgi:hypothetical protein
VQFRQEENDDAGIVGVGGNHFAYRRQDALHLVR